MAPATALLRQTPLIFLLLLLLNSRPGRGANTPGHIDCSLIEGAKEVDGNCACEDPDDFFDGRFLKCISPAFEGIDSPCNEDRQCGLRMGQGAACVAGVCACPQGYHYMHGVCWKTSGFGEACKVDAECFAYAESDAYTCADGFCACAEDAVQQRPGSSSPLCKRVSREGEECESNLDCEGNLTCELVSDSSLDYSCQGTATKNSAFQRTVAENRTRASRERRTPGKDSPVCGSNEELTPSGAACVCQASFFRTSTSAPCLPELGELCWVGEDNSHQHIQYATCRRSAKFPYTTTPDPTTPDPTTTDPTTPDPTTPEPTTPDPTTRDGVWACLGGFVADAQNRKCEKTRKVTMNCMVDPQCAYYAGYCENKKCRCEEGTTYDSQKLMCLSAKGLSEECEVDDDCIVATANSVECREGICQCKESFHEMGNDCKKNADQLGDECTDTSDCVFALEDDTIVCEANVCSCTAGYFELDDTSCQVGIRGPCNEDLDCFAVENSICVDGLCQCSEDYVSVSTSECFPETPEYGGECEEDEQCFGLTTDGENILCASEKCVCKDDYHYINRKCWPFRRLNDACASQSECVAENSLCMNNYCRCDFGYVADGDLTCKGNAASFILSLHFATLASIAIASRLL